MLSALSQRSRALVLHQPARAFGSKNGLKVPNIAVAGASGAVGCAHPLSAPTCHVRAAAPRVALLTRCASPHRRIEMLKMIESRGVPFNDLKLFAHPDEAGETVSLDLSNFPRYRTPPPRRRTTPGRQPLNQARGLLRR